MAIISFLGTGNASILPVKRDEGGFDCAWQSNLLLQTGEGKKILLDCGTDIRFSTWEAGLMPTDFDGVYISHVHADHALGLEWLAYQTCFREPKQRPKLYCEVSMFHSVERAIMPGLVILESGRVDIHHYFEYVPLSTKAILNIDDVYVHPVEAVHVRGPDPKLSLGLFFEGPKKTVFWTSDSVFQPDTFHMYYRQADIILQDCQLGPPNDVHARIDELRTLPAEIKRKMILYHHDPRFVPQPEHSDHDEFRGFATKGLAIEF